VWPGAQQNFAPIHKENGASVQTLSTSVNAHTLQNLSRELVAPGQVEPERQGRNEHGGDDPWEPRMLIHMVMDKTRASSEDAGKNGEMSAYWR
jgi:hypothetical protein